jgi:hypothetical protein
MKTLERIYRLLGSFGLAIAILLGMFVTTFVGTLEQVHRGLYEVQRDYFESIIAWHPVVAGDVAFGLPLPGGGLLMGLLALNLAVGGMIRMRKDRRRLGILVTHLGIALLLAAGFVKFASGEDGYLALVPGESSSEFRSHYEWEVAIREVDGRRELLIPDADLRALEVDPFGNPAEPYSFTGRLGRALTTGRLDGFAAQRFAHPDLPFELELSNFVANASVAPVGPMWQPTLPVVDGYSVVWRPKETEAELNSPAIEARALGPTGETLGASILAGVARAPWTLTSEGRTFLVELRARRFSMPFELRLDEFHKEEHPRTDIPSVYRSDVTTVRPEGPSEQARIEMNRPLRDGGLVLFQASFGERPTAGGPVTFSQFAVVRNPADKWPEYACWVIAAGMLLAFGERLLGFMRAQSARRAAEVGR